MAFHERLLSLSLKRKEKKKKTKLNKFDKGYNGDWFSGLHSGESSLPHLYTYTNELSANWM
jgi:hypothetical protein